MSSERCHVLGAGSGAGVTPVSETEGTPAPGGQSQPRPVGLCRGSHFLPALRAPTRNTWFSQVKSIQGGFLCYQVTCSDVGEGSPRNRVVTGGCHPRPWEGEGQAAGSHMERPASLGGGARLSRSTSQGGHTPCRMLLLLSLAPRPLAEPHGQRARGPLYAISPGPPFRAEDRAEKGGQWAWRGRQTRQRLCHNAAATKHDFMSFIKLDRESLCDPAVPLLVETQRNGKGGGALLQEASGTPAAAGFLPLQAAGPACHAVCRKATLHLSFLICPPIMVPSSGPDMVQWLPVPHTRL